MKSTFLLVILYCFIPQTVPAQQPELVLKGTEEKRNIGFSPSKLELTTELTGIEVDEKHQVRLKEITVTNNLGSTLQPTAGYPYPTDYFIKNNEIVIGIAPPKREAKSVSVQGTIEYFTISEALKSKLNITNLQQQTHKNLLANTGSETKLVLIDLKNLNKLNEEDKTAYYKKVKEIHEKAGVGNTIDEAKHYLDKALRDFNAWTGEASKLLHFYKEDSNNNIIEIKVLKNGENLFNGSYSNNNTYNYTLKENLTAEIRLQIIVKNERAIKEIPFQFKKINLP